MANNETIKLDANKTEIDANAIELDKSLDDKKQTRSISMLTLIDNPYDYFTQFDEWFMYDNEQQSKLDLPNNCCGYLDRIVAQLGGITDDMTENEENQLIDKAIDEIIAINPFHIYKKVTKQVVAE